MTPQNPELKLRLLHEKIAENEDPVIANLLFGGFLGSSKPKDSYQAEMSDGNPGNDRKISSSLRLSLLNRVPEELKNYTGIKVLDVIVDPSFLETDEEQVFRPDQVVSLVEQLMGYYGEKNGIDVRYHMP